MKTEKNNNSPARKKIFLEPGKTNKEDRINFVKFWANYVKTHSDEDWSEQQNIIINAQMQ